MLSEAKPALKPDLREAKGNPNRGAVLPKGNPNRGAVLPKGNPNRGGGDARRAIPSNHVCIVLKQINRNSLKLFRISSKVKQFSAILRNLYYYP